MLLDLREQREQPVLPALQGVLESQDLQALLVLLEQRGLRVQRAPPVLPEVQGVRALPVLQEL